MGLRLDNLRNQGARHVLVLSDSVALCHWRLLGHALRRSGRFAEARDSYRRGHELGSKKPGWPYPSAGWLRDAIPLAAGSIDSGVAEKKLEGLAELSKAVA